MGRQTRQALRAFQQRQGLGVTREPDAPTLAALAAGEPLVEVEISSRDHEGLAPIPRGWLAKSQALALAHETVLERLAERHHAAQRVVRELNPCVAWPDPPPGTRVRVPRVDDARGGGRAAQLVILLDEKLVRVLDAEGRIMAQFPCSIGADAAKRPVGALQVVAAAENPVYTFDPEVFPEDAEARSLGRRLILPAGPNNPVGTVWLSLDRPGYGIHGTPKPEDIGRTESHGCFRLANWNAERLLRLVIVPMPVTVLP